MTEPSSYCAALQIPKWYSAMQIEFRALLEQNTWDLVPKPQDHPIISSKWLFKIKLHVDGSLARHKVRLIALGNH